MEFLIASLQEHQFHPVEVKYGLLQLAEGLSFLHNDAKLFHGNLTPEIVIINHKGEWKLGGFHFCCYTQYTSSAQVSMYPCTELMKGTKALTLYRALLMHLLHDCLECKP